MVADTSNDLLNTLVKQMTHHNKDYKFQVLKTMGVIVNEYIHTISKDTKKYQGLFYKVLSLMWNILKTQTIPTENED